MKKRLVSLFLLVVLAFGLMGVVSCLENWKRDLTTNYARLDDASSDPSLRPFVLEMPLGQAADHVQRWVASTARWEMLSREQHGTTIVLHLARRTRVLRFVDDIHVRLLEQPGHQQEGQTRVEADSKSRLGKGDLGQNPRNLRELRSGLLP